MPWRELQPANYSIYFDLNGDGDINVTDIVNTLSRLPDSVTGADPGTPATGWVARVIQRASGWPDCRVAARGQHR